MNYPKNKFLAIPLAMLVIGVIGSSSADAQTLAHRYSFSGNANDSVGTANGTLRSAATIDTDLLNTTSAGSNDTNGGVLLPLAATAGITGSFSIETYVIGTGTTAPFSSLYFFGTESENHFTQTNGANEIRTRLDPPTGGEQGTGSFAFPAGPTQVVSVFDSTALTLSLYFNGALQATAPLSVGTTFNLSLYDGAIAGVPPAGYNDSSFNGSTDDFRIYNGALSAGQVTALNLLGADATNAAIFAAVPEPGTAAFLALGALALTARRRRLA